MLILFTHTNETVENALCLCFEFYFGGEKLEKQRRYLGVHFVKKFVKKCFSKSPSNIKGSCVNENFVHFD